MTEGKTAIIVTGDTNRNKVLTVPGGGMATIKIELPSDWNDLMNAKGYKPLNEYYLRTNTVSEYPPNAQYQQETNKTQIPQKAVTQSTQQKDRHRSSIDKCDSNQDKIQITDSVELKPQILHNNVDLRPRSIVKCVNKIGIETINNCEIYMFIAFKISFISAGVFLTSQLECLIALSGSFNPLPVSTQTIFEPV